MKLKTYLEIGYFNKLEFLIYEQILTHLNWKKISLKLDITENVHLHISLHGYVIRYGYMESVDTSKENWVYLKFWSSGKYPEGFRPYI